MFTRPRDKARRGDGISVGCRHRDGLTSHMGVDEGGDRTSCGLANEANQGKVTSANDLRNRQSLIPTFLRSA